MEEDEASGALAMSLYAPILVRMQHKAHFLEQFLHHLVAVSGFQHKNRAPLFNGRVEWFLQQQVDM